jgi:benzylsuccinate CoA-transferase BbsE subunit
MGHMTVAKPESTGQTEGPLFGLRVLDLSGAAGQYCGKLFAGLGAEVILIEPPGGSPARKEGPFIDDVEGPESSIPFFYFNASKRSMVLDLDSEEDRGLFRRLVRHADVIVETEKPGAMAARGLGYDELRRIRPSLTYVAITPFGQTGPFVDYEADDLTLLALGGLLSLGGYPGAYPEGAPMAIYGNQAYLAACQFAAVAAMAVIIDADARGVGDFIDISIQESVTLALENAVQFYDLEGVIRKRARLAHGFPGQHSANDGDYVIMAGGVAGSDAWGALVRWIAGIDTASGAILQEPRWVDPQFIETPEARDEFVRIIAAATGKYSREQLYESAKASRVPMGPVLAPLDILCNRQAAYRRFFVEVWFEAAKRDILMPRAPYLLSATPAPAPRAAPALGAHGAAIKQMFSL